MKPLDDEVLKHIWATGAAEQLIVLLREEPDLDRNRDGRGTLRSHLARLHAEIERTLRR
jgi:hypothetical protein